MAVYVIPNPSTINFLLQSLEQPIPFDWSIKKLIALMDNFAVAITAILFHFQEKYF